MEIMMDFGFQLSYTWHRMFQYSSSENKMENMKTSLVAQWLRLQTSSAGGMDSISVGEVSSYLLRLMAQKIKK